MVLGSADFVLRVCSLRLSPLCRITRGGRTCCGRACSFLPLLAASIVLVGVGVGADTGCGGRSMGATGDAGLGRDAAVTRDARPDRDGTAWPDGGPGIDLYAVLSFEHDVQDGEYAYEQATWSGAVYEVAYLPPEPTIPDFVEQRVTPDGVPCDIYFSSPQWEGGGRGGGHGGGRGGGGASPLPPDPPEPAPLNGGEIRMEAPSGTGGAFAIHWDGAAYAPDSRYRSGAEGDLPGWITQSALTGRVVFAGNDRLIPFEDRLEIVDVPEIVVPGVDGDLSPDADGVFRIEWRAEPNTPVTVRLDMNMDWDDAVFVCRPPTGQPSILLPNDWIQQYSWGSGELRVIARQDQIDVGPNTSVFYRIRRGRHRSVSFEISAPPP